MSVQNYHRSVIHTFNNGSAGTEECWFGTLRWPQLRSMLVPSELGSVAIEEYEH